MAHTMNTEKQAANPYTAYTDGRFWRAYASLYWPDLNDNAELASFAKSVADGLPERQPGEPIRILALGFGFGGVELPILHYLKRITGAPLECVVIDKEAEPLRFAEILLENGIENIPPTMAEIVHRFGEFPKQGKVTSEIRERWKREAKVLPDGDSFRFIQDDLDWEPLPDGSPLPICPEPSRWADRLADTLGESHRYHVVFASFCFFHIGWWQRVLYDSLGAMVEGGLFLHSRVEGDEAIFEGRPGKRNSEKRISNATKIFRDGIFADREVVKALQAPRGASASRPFVIDEYLVRLEPFGLDRLTLAESQTQLRYTVRNNVGCDTYRDLLGTQGFSTFRLLAKQLKNDERYKELCDKALLNTGGNCSDDLEIDFIWSVHKVSPQTLMQCPLHPLFRIEATWESPKKALADAYKTEYALNGASSIHSEIGVDESDHALLAGTIGKKLNQQELLHPDCLALQFGFIPRGADKPDFFYVPNFSQTYANVQERQIRELTLYQSILKSSSTISPSETYSNTQTLLDVALQKFSKPCIFAYHLGAKGFRIEHRPARDYEEIRFYVPPAHDTIRLELNEQLHTWMSSIKRINTTVEDNEPKTKAVFALSDFEVPQATIEAMNNVLFDVGSLFEIKELLRGQVDKIETLEPGAIDALKEAITDSSVYRSVCLQFLADTKLIVFYPASYEIAGTNSGRDLVIVSYAKDMLDASIESEYHKFYQVFGKIRFRRQEEDVRADEEKKSHEELKRSHQMLQLLQKPLDALSDAFLKVQAEAQEMQSILNEPEEGLFKSHRLLAPMFQEKNTIHISPFLYFEFKHDYESSGINLDSLKQAYAYALCAIFGEDRALAQAQTVMAVTQMAFSALKQVRERGVHNNMCKALVVICGLNDPCIENSVLPLKLANGKEEKPDDMGERLSSALQNLKAVLFTPFKEFGGDWPRLPVELAGYGVDKFLVPGEDTAKLKDKNTHTLQAANTPVAQHAVLTFLVGMRNELNTADYLTDIAGIECHSVGGKGNVLEEYTLTLKKQKPKNGGAPPLFFDAAKSDAQETLQQFIQVCLRHRLKGENVGSFHGVFHRLLRHTLNTVSLGGRLQFAVEGQWCYLPPPDAIGGTTLLLALGKVKNTTVNFSDLEKKMEPTAGHPKVEWPFDKFSRYFFIVQTQLSDVTEIRLIWSDCSEKWYFLRRSSAEFIQSASGDKAKYPLPESAHSRGEVPISINQELLKVYIIDHNTNEPWLSVFVKLCEWCQTEGVKIPNYAVHDYTEYSQFSPPADELCLVVLHLNMEKQMANGWKIRLESLENVKRVFIVSAGGNAENKHIGNTGKFKILKETADKINGDISALQECYCEFLTASSEGRAK